MTDAPGGTGAADYALVLGSNRSPARHLRFAIRRIAAEYDVIACTPALRTRDADGGRFLNAAVRIRCAQSLEALRQALHAIEGEAGRVRGGKAVALDIDIVASVDAAGMTHVHKPDDLRRDYVRTLLGRIGF